MTEQQRQGTAPVSRRARWSWRDTTVVVGIVAVGVGAAWVLPHRSPDPGSGIVDDWYRSEPVVYPVEIPGCDAVEPPPRRVDSGWTAYGASLGYGDPDFPWLTATKATAMTEALRGALPPDVEVLFDAPSRMLLFQPIFRMNPDTLPDGVEAGGSSDAGGALARADGAAGRLRAAVRQWDGGAPPCVAGELDERRTFSDGTVVDVLDTWTERLGDRTLVRSATAYAPDGSRISLSVNDGAGWFADGNPAHSGAPPLTVDELGRIAIDPGLRTTTPVPEGTPPARMGCGSGVEPMGDPVDRATVDGLGAALDAAWNALGDLSVTPDRSIGALEVASSARDAVCTEVTLEGPSGEGRLGVTIYADTSAPEEFGAADLRPDGTRIRVSHNEGTLYVTAARPSGTAVTVTLTGAGPTSDQLVALATAPSLDL